MPNFYEAMQIDCILRRNLRSMEYAMKIHMMRNYEEQKDHGIYLTF